MGFGATKILLTTKGLLLDLQLCSQGMIEFWRTEGQYDYPEEYFEYKYKMKTDLYELAKNKGAYCFQSNFSNDGKLFSIYGSDRM